VSGDAALGLALALPLVGAVAVLALHRRPNLREAATLLVGLATLGAVIELLRATQAGASPALSLLEVLPGIRLAFSVEPLGLLFGLVASGLWIVTSVYSIGYMRGHHETNQTRFYAFFAVAIACALGIAFASNLFTLFLFYEALTLSTYPLVTHHGNARALRAGRVYLGVLLSTSIGLFLLALVWTYHLAGTLEFTRGGLLAGHVNSREAGLLLILFAFGTGKAALMPFHRWLPAAMVAPTPVSALLHAVAVVKAGVFTVLKIVIYVFGPQLVTGSEASQGLAWAAAVTIIAASVVALRQDNLKARLAYSTVSQLGYIVLGAVLATPAALLGGALHIAMHACGKITLFFCAGAIQVAAHKTEISQMRGLGRRMPWTLGAFGLAALSIIGLPPLGGSWSKWLLMLGSLQARQPLLVGVLMVSSLLNVAYLLPPVARGFFSAPPADEAAGHGEAPLLCLLPLALTAVGSVALFFGVDALWALLHPLIGP